MWTKWPESGQVSISEEAHVGTIEQVGGKIRHIVELAVGEHNDRPIRSRGGGEGRSEE
jgi:hypothetical protein